ncbi:MAG: nuclear transport factor 2 family protein [Candidatus Hydrogenedentota bacterium]
MKPTELVQRWVDHFNAADVDKLVALYAEDAVNHQVVTEPLEGRVQIRKLFEIEFVRAKMVCIPEIIHEAGDWAIMEWSDPLGLRGCGFFHVKDDQIIFQRGYFDQLTFFKIQGPSIPDNYLGE